MFLYTDIGLYIQVGLTWCANPKKAVYVEKYPDRELNDPDWDISHSEVGAPLSIVKKLSES